MAPRGEVVPENCVTHVLLQQLDDLEHGLLDCPVDGLEVQLGRVGLLVGLVDTSEAY